ncbi:methylated-DNA--[protein]-cysteine S-methyltransferase [Desulfobacca acetoxidans]|uniref:methylated-DNA--[protein]-cysteine S-methyltransferase n=1 Tax=Desulfobacca acetoxidans (strain ATCC 700848 / DSM 11109 / ASRB2) TaxID=880072 RepID=F2NJE8_DESAR|nr:methylated-DNA--[protein]-cysteine S-methyltransferase [Desulfobacca acetoxidans]AEB09460.1 methylated-DNA/protein-cysteinemethyltransferase [Desulfobacca acetoxidans DSM 11109]
MRRVRSHFDRGEVSDIWGEMLQTPLCPLWLYFSRSGLRAVYFNHPGQQLGPQWPVRVRPTEAKLMADLHRWRWETVTALGAYFDGRIPDFGRLTLDMRGTAFQVRVWQALRQTPFGGLTSYQKLAQCIGMPGGARAVGGALRVNPLPIIIPCHRVLTANGGLGGFSAGLNYKRYLLSHERLVLDGNPLPPYVSDC